MVETRVLCKTSNQFSPTYLSRYICCRYQYKNRALKMVLTETCFQMLQPLRSNTKRDTQDSHYTGELCGEGCSGLRFYSVILPFEKQILQINGHSNEKLIVLPFILSLTGLPSMSRGQAEHSLSTEICLPQDVFRNCCYHSPHHNQEKKIITQLINNTKQLCFVNASFMVTQVPDLCLHSKKSADFTFPISE